MTTPTTSYTIQKTRQGVTWKLRGNTLMVPFPYIKPSDVRVFMGSQRLTEGTHYTLDGSIITLHDQNLGLDQSSPLKITFYVSRLTEIPDITFTPGHPVKAQDLNDWFQVLVLRTQELDTLTRSNSWVSDTPPPEPWKGMLWTSTLDYRIHCWTGSEWVDVK